MKEFLTYNWKTITLTFLGIIFVYLLVRTFTPIPVSSELNQYKLDQIDQKVKNIEKLGGTPKKKSEWDLTSLLFIFD